MEWERGLPEGGGGGGQQVERQGSWQNEVEVHLAEACIDLTGKEHLSKGLQHCRNCQIAQIAT